MLTSQFLCAIIEALLTCQHEFPLKERKLESIRFEKFSLLIDGIHKCINKLKIDRVPELGIKSVHVFWMYQLKDHPEGLTASKIAAASMIDRSLVSREIEALREAGYVTMKSSGRRYVLTEQGMGLADKITDIVMEVQREVDCGITEEELVSFYTTLKKLHDNFVNITESGRKAIK